MKEYLAELEKGLDLAIIENKQLVVMGDIKLDYLTLIEKERLDGVIVPNVSSVGNSSVLTRVTAQKSSLSGSAIKIGQNYSFVSDTLVKKDQKATLSIFNSKLPNFCKTNR